MVISWYKVEVSVEFAGGGRDGLTMVVIHRFISVSLTTHPHLSVIRLAHHLLPRNTQIPTASFFLSFQKNCKFFTGLMKTTLGESVSIVRLKMLRCTPVIALTSIALLFLRL